MTSPSGKEGEVLGAERRSARTHTCGKRAISCASSSGLLRARPLGVTYSHRPMLKHSSAGNFRPVRMISSARPCAVGQKTDSKIPETLSSVATLATAVGGLARSTALREGACKPSARLYNIDKGLVDPKPVVVIP